GWDLCFSPDGKVLASVGMRCVHLFDVASCSERARLPMAEGVNGGLGFTRDGRALAVMAAGSVKVFEMASGGLRRNIEVAREARGVKLHPGGRFAATSSKDTVHVVDLQEGKVVASMAAGRGGWVYALAFSADGSKLVSGGSRMNGVVWDATGLDRPGEAVKLKEEELRRLWEELASEDASGAYDAVVKLAGGDGATMRFLRERMVGALNPDVKELEGLVGKLDSDQFVEREKAAEALVKWGAVTEVALEKAMKGNATPQVRAAIEDIRSRGRQSAGAEELRLMRGIEVMEIANSREGREVLEEMAKRWPAGRVREAGEGTLKRVGVR
ncbi:MAG TPA: hypothetical protein VGQ99_09050, partial [Tepidisphaeraceae bacterium]|nr:hypothetical protein [Tepidisphaeraceae bacterium]